MLLVEKDITRSQEDINSLYRGRGASDLLIPCHTKAKLPIAASSDEETKTH